MLENRLTLSVRESAEATGISKSTLWRMVASGELPSFQVRGRRLIHKDALNCMLKVNVPPPSSNIEKLNPETISVAELFPSSVRIRNCLNMNNIKNLAQLLELSPRQLMNQPNFGTTSLKEVKIVLDKFRKRLYELPQPQPQPIPVAHGNKGKSPWFVTELNETKARAEAAERRAAEAEELATQGEAETCSNCRFFHFKSCRRYAPKISETAPGVQTSKWPAMAPDDFCGDWKSKNRPAAPRICQECRKPFDPRAGTGGRAQKFCDPECRSAFHARRRN